jgi:DnaJ family protein C protein 17
MMQDLHDREHAHEIEKKAKVVEEQVAARLKVEIARIRKQHAQQQEKVPRFSYKRNLSVPPPGTAHHIDASDIDKTIKVTWDCLEGGSGGYSAEQLKDIFKEFGEVEDIVIRQGKSRRKSSALLVMGSKEAAIAATQRQCGDISNPLLAVPATVTTGAASVTSEQWHPMAASQPTTRVSNGLVGASDRSFEDATLLKMRQVHLAPFFLCLYPCTSCYTSCLKQNSFEKRQEQTGVSHTCSVSEVTTL